MSNLWVFSLVISVFFALFGNNIAETGAAALEGAPAAINFLFLTGGLICLWGGALEIMRRSGLTRALARLLRPALAALFPRAARDGEALAAMTMNVSANILGLGNAATPMGIAAARRMARLSGGGSADAELCLLVVINTASVQLLPTTAAALRAANGAAQPFDILPAVWLSSAGSVAAGILAAKLLERVWPR